MYINILCNIADHLNVLQLEEMYIRIMDSLINANTEEAIIYILSMTNDFYKIEVFSLQDVEYSYLLIDELKEIKPV